MQSKSEVNEVKHPQSAWTRAAHFCGRYTLPSVRQGAQGNPVSWCGDLLRLASAWREWASRETRAGSGPSQSRLLLIQSAGLPLLNNSLFVAGSTIEPVRFAHPIPARRSSSWRDKYPLIPPRANWGSPRAGLRPHTHHLARRWP